MTENRITNEDAIGDYFVVLIAHKNRVASFSVKTLEDAETEARRIARQRANEGKSTHEAFARKIVDRKVIKRQRYFTFGDRIEIGLPQ